MVALSRIRSARRMEDVALASVMIPCTVIGNAGTGAGVSSSLQEMRNNARRRSGRRMLVRMGVFVHLGLLELLVLKRVRIDQNIERII